MHVLKLTTTTARPNAGSAIHSLRQRVRSLAEATPLTARGALVALFAGVSLWRFGFGTLDLLLFVVGISGLVLVALAALTIGAAAVYLKRRPGRGTMETGRRAADVVPITWRGVFIALFSAAALWRWGYGKLDLLLFVIGISGLVLVALSATAAAAAAVYLRRRIDAPALGTRSLEAGSPIRTGFRLPALGRVPLVKLRWEWRRPAGVDCRILARDGELVEEVVARRLEPARYSLALLMS